MDLYTFRADIYAIPASGQSDPLPDVKGWDVEASDGHIGKVDDATYDTSSSCLVVDTGFWIFGKKRMIPAGVVDRIDPGEQKMLVSMTKEQIRQAPDYDPDRHRDDQHGYQHEVGEYFDGSGTSTPPARS